jgi:predicted TIM-barrel enzyme
MPETLRFYHQVMETISGRTSGETCISGAEGVILSGKRTGAKEEKEIILF